MRMRHGPCSIVPYYLINGTIFETEFSNIKMCVLNFSTPLSETFFSLGRAERNVIKKYIGCQVQYRYYCPILMKLQFSLDSF